MDYSELASKIASMDAGINHKTHLAMQLADALRVIDGSFIPKDFIEKATGKPHHYYPMSYLYNSVKITPRD